MHRFDLYATLLFDGIYYQNNLWHHSDKGNESVLEKIQQAQKYDQICQHDFKLHQTVEWKKNPPQIN